MLTTMTKKVITICGNDRVHPPSSKIPGYAYALSIASIGQCDAKSTSKRVHGLNTKVRTKVSNLVLKEMKKTKPKRTRFPIKNMIRYPLPCRLTPLYIFSNYVRNSGYTDDQLAKI